MRLVLILTLVTGIGLMTVPTSNGDDLDRFEARVFAGEDGARLPYRLLKPRAYDPGMRYPLVLFLHGAGERGDDNKAQLVHGMADYASDALMKQYPCFVMAPQCPEGKLWVDVDWTSTRHDMPAQPTTALRLTMEALAGLEREFSIAPDRIYITGLSMGGYGVWDALQRYPRRFAAAAPICGGGDVKLAKRIVHVPIWAFHGDSDTAVPPERSRSMIAAITEAGGSPKYTEYPDTGHDSWTATYKDPALHAWMFSQKKKE